MKLELSLTIELPENSIDFNDSEEKDWFLKEVLIPEQLCIHSNVFGDTLGDTIEVKNINLYE